MLKNLLHGVTASAVALLAVMFLAPRAHADPVTLQFESVGGQSAEGESVFPYNFSVNNSPATTRLMCLNFFNDINFGESWQATPVAVTSTLDKEAAYLFFMADTSTNPTTVQDAQFAAWMLFATGVPNPDPSGVRRDLRLAKKFADTSTDEAFYNQFVIYDPVSGTQTWGGIPQTFIGRKSSYSSLDAPNPSAVPEPSPFLLILTGILGLMAVTLGGNFWSRMRWAAKTPSHRASLRAE